jgi:class 3 adenylate cyclase/DNA-binding winged helix-turn-helix (wHTH) protein
MIYRFGDHELDLDRYELRRDGTVVELEPQVFDVLAYLVEHRDRVVTKAELLDEVWGDRFVSESALTSRMKQARRAIGDDGRTQGMIRTAHRRGYRFVAPVTEAGSTEAGSTTPAAAPVRPPGEPRQVSVPIRYAKSDGLNIAFQITGQGPPDLVLVAGFVSHLDMDWAHPAHTRFLDRLGSFSRLIRFDKRGTGLSDRPGGVPDLETRMDDVRAVMDRAGSERAVLFGYSEGGPMAALFAATYPERTEALVLYGSYARRLWSPDYPWATTEAERLRYGEQLERDWGWENDMRIMCPSADESLARWWGERCRASASPGTVRTLIEMNSVVDVRAVLPTIGVPTLVMHRTGDRDSRVEEGRFIAEQIPGARFIELSGDDHFVAVDPDQILDPVEEFVRGARAVPPPATRVLATVVFADIVGSTELAGKLGDSRLAELLMAFHAIAGAAVTQHGGRLVKTMGDGVLATFDGPARAVRSACAIRDAVAELGLTVRAGVHTAEIELVGDDVAGVGVHIGARVGALASPGEVWVSRTVRDLVSGSGLRLEDRGTHELRGTAEAWQLYAVAAETAA